MAIPTDPRIANQWHLQAVNLFSNAAGNPSVWDDYTGRGVNVGVYDNGVQANHFEFNYDSSLEFTYNGVVRNGQIPGDHGTFVAGVIAADNNGIDTVGVAYDAILTGVTYGNINDFTADYVTALFNHQANFDVVNHSWGFPTFTETSQPHNGIYRAITDGMTHAAEDGRGGLGTIMVAAASNQRFVDQGWDNTSRDANTVGAVVGDRHTITVAAAGPDEFVTDYSTPGSNILVTAPSGALWENSATTGIVATDRMDDATAGFQNGPDGWAVGNVADGAFGTSFASPIVAGVVALMLEANPNLGWRDVREILASSAVHLGSDMGVAPQNSELHAWFVNAARDWNGGGHAFSEDYGFGGVDAHGAVRLAETWTEQKTSDNEQFRSAAQYMNMAIPDATAPNPTNANQNVNFTIGEGLSVETVEIYLGLTHSWMGDLEITLTSPLGTTTTLLQHVTGSADVQSLNLVSNAFLGEESGGTWRVNIADTVGSDVGTLFFASLDVFGSADNEDDTFIYTDQYAASSAVNVWRSYVDGHDGHDTLNAAAVTGNCTIDLRGTATGLGGNSSIGGSVLRILGGIEDAITGDGEDVLIGNDDANWLRGMRGVDQLNGGGNSDRLEGGAGGDRLYGDGGNDTVIGGADDDTVVGGNDQDTLYGGFVNYLDSRGQDGNDIIVGGAGDDTIIVSLQNDTVSGDADIDTLSFAWVSGGVTADLNVGSTTFWASGGWSIPGGGGGGWGRNNTVTWSGIENLTGGTGADTLTGNAVDNVLSGDIGNDRLAGGGGVNILNGGADSDRFMLGNAIGHAVGGVDAADTAGWMDKVAGFDTANGGDGVDTADFSGFGASIWVALDYAGQPKYPAWAAWTLDRDDLNEHVAVWRGLADLKSVENVVGTAKLDWIWGDAGANVIDGGAGNDLLDGGVGVDTVIGGAGDDILVVDSLADQAIEYAGQGTDTVYAAESYALGANIENLYLGANYQYDIYYGTEAGYPIHFERGTDASNGYGYGNDLANTIVGSGGANTLDGKGGADVMIGGLGNDFYFVDNAADVVAEGGGEGTGDRVFASVSYALGAGVQVETLTTTNNGGTAAINLTGNEFVNAIYGNAGANMLDGKGGADTMAGFGGDDFYFVDNAADAVFEGAGQGSDRVFASASYRLGAGVQVETLTTTNNGGTAAINLTGNEFANTIFGNAGTNTLDGKGGIDALLGLGGDDFYFVDNAADQVYEAAGQGSDRVFASVDYTLAAGQELEKLSTADNAGFAPLNLTGNELANTIYGNAGSNGLKGGLGNDVLVGFGGADAFVFNTALGATNVDQIGDFSHAAGDRIVLHHGIFTTLATGTLSANAFYAGAAAHDASDHIIYNGATGALFYDDDGIGGHAAVQFASVSAGLFLTQSDFLVV